MFASVYYFYNQNISLYKHVYVYIQNERLHIVGLSSITAIFSGLHLDHKRVS